MLHMLETLSHISRRQTKHFFKHCFCLISISRLPVQSQSQSRVLAVVQWTLSGPTFSHAPRILATSDLLAVHLDHDVAANHRQWHLLLEQTQLCLKNSCIQLQRHQTLHPSWETLISS